MLTLAAQVAPLLAAPLAVQIHFVTAIAAFLLGLVQFAAPKGTVNHRVAGWIWVGLMMVVALSSFFIVDFRDLKPTAIILGLSLFVLVQVPLAVHAARGGRIRAHRLAMTGLFLGALVVAGTFTLLPGRLMSRVVFG